MNFLCLRILPLLLFTASCTIWHKADDWDPQGHWSDDEESVLIIKNYFEQRRPFGASADITRNNEVEIFTVSVQTPKKKTKLGIKRVGTIGQVQFMRKAGYVLVERKAGWKTVIEDKKQIEKVHKYFDKITMDGAVSPVADKLGTVMFDCGDSGEMQPAPSPLEVIASIDGSKFAVINIEADCKNTTGTLTFLNAKNLSVIEGPFSLRLKELNQTDELIMLKSAWLPSGGVFVGFAGGFGGRGFRGWKYQLGQEPAYVEQMPRTCLISDDFTNNQGKIARVLRGDKQDIYVSIERTRQNQVKPVHCP